EDPKKPWPKLKDGRGIGPFYLIWSEPKKSNIGSEEWPFMLAGFDVKRSVEETFPLTAPKGGSDSVARGYKSFQKNCFACHTLNGQGASQMGPDLNVPMSVTEYFSSDGLRSIVRDPQKVRKWPQAKMKGFTKEAISDKELDSLVEYLKHMSRNRPK
ncbi:MAG: cytochrome c, partial [Bdellovibrionia bacterium]